MLVSDEMVQKAFDWLNENSRTAAAARAAKVRAEHHVKKTKARLFLEADGSNQVRESHAINHDDYFEACEMEAVAVEEDQYHINQRNRAIAIIDAWRTEQSNYRAMQRVG